MDGLDFQEIKKSELENEFTIGAEYYGKKYVESISVVKRQKKTIPLGQMWILATDGDHGSPDYQESGVLYLLSECVKEGYIEKAKCRYITEAKNRELKRSCLHPGDIVVTKTGVYFGKSAVIPESIPEANTIDVFTADGMPRGDKPFLNAYKEGIMPFVQKNIDTDDFAQELFSMYPIISQQPQEIT